MRRPIDKGEQCIAHRVRPVTNNTPTHHEYFWACIWFSMAFGGFSLPSSLSLVVAHVNSNEVHFYVVLNRYVFFAKQSRLLYHCTLHIGWCTSAYSIGCNFWMYFIINPIVHSIAINFPQKNLIKISSGWIEIKWHVAIRTIRLATSTWILHCIYAAREWMIRSSIYRLHFFVACKKAVRFPLNYYVRLPPIPRPIMLLVSKREGRFNSQSQNA